MPGQPMHKRMGYYLRQEGEAHNDRPTYRFHSPVYGTAFLYYEQITPTEQYWVVGDKIGSKDVQLGVVDPAPTADQVQLRAPR
jgi:hypothetical protein